MIFDTINNLPTYVIPQVDKILNFIAHNNCLLLPNEQIDIDGKELFVKVMEYVPKPASENKFETHMVHADLQYVVAGVELMQIVPKKALKPLGEYDKQADYEFYKADQLITDLVVEAGQFTVFYPGEAHKPSCLYQNNQNIVKKLVFKIRMK